MVETPAPWPSWHVVGRIGGWGFRVFLRAVEFGFKGLRFS